MPRVIGLLALVLALTAAAPAAAQDPPEPATATGITEPVYTDSVVEEFRVPTPFGQVYGWVRRPVVPAGVKVPVILTYSPYHLVESQTPGTDPYTYVTDYFVPRGYARSFVHLIGTGNSEGCYDHGGRREIETGAAVVDWLGTQAWSNGKVGMIGVSYDGTTQWSAAITGTPHLAAIVPQSAISRWYHYAHINGVRNQSGSATPFAFDAGFTVGIPDTGSGPAVVDNARLCEAVAHNEKAFGPDPIYDGYWDERDYVIGAEKIRAAALIEHSWADENVHPHNTIDMWRALPAGTPKRLIMELDGHSDSQLEDAVNIRHAWFDRYLLGLPTGVEKLPAADSTDAALKTRTQSAAWPPPETRTAELTLGTEFGFGALASERGTTWSDTHPQLDERDVLDDTLPGVGIRFGGPVMEHDVRIVDTPEVDLPIKTDQLSTHVQVVLYDEVPAADGTAASRTAITRGVMNSRNRHSVRLSEPLAPGEPWRARFELLPRDYILQKHHRLGIAVMSANAHLSLYNDDTAATNELLLAQGAKLRIKASVNGDRLGQLVPLPAAAGVPVVGAPDARQAADRFATARITRQSFGRRTTIRGTATAGTRGLRRVELSLSRLGRSGRCQAVTGRGRLGKAAKRGGPCRSSAASRAGPTSCGPAPWTARDGAKRRRRPRTRACSSSARSAPARTRRPPPRFRPRPRAGRRAPRGPCGRRRTRGTPGWRRWRTS
jgi:X-Pro dipeptidyl-peptidase